MAITDDDCNLVVDPSNYWIQVLSVEGQFLALVGTKGKEPFQFEFPVSIVIHLSGQFLVSKTDSNHISLSLTYLHVPHIDHHEEKWGKVILAW